MVLKFIVIFHPIVNACQYYYDHLPDDTFQTIGKSFLFSFSIGMILRNSTNNYLQPIVAASVAALASLIHALMTPLFDAIFGDRKVNMFREGIKFWVVTAFANILREQMATGKVNLVAVPNVIPISLNFVKSSFNLYCDAADAMDPISANYLRSFMRNWGLIAEEGSNSTYLIG